ncbi:MAG TPA: serine/threonine-protein kinase [Thermoanaerobaculia bacterium]|nr:serine/threonine-protein kinase [Thermoanaerobaculia bacterium]
MTTPDSEATARIDSDARRTPRGRGGEAQFAPGTIVAGRYRISGILGSGGMGEVYRADDIKLGQQVALKFLPARLARDGSLLGHLHDEVRHGRQIAHPNVCRVYDIIEWNDAHFVSMEYVDGEDLSRLLRRIGRLAHDKAVDIAGGIAAGLHAAHGKGILHRDLKPANIMIDSHGQARIMDFGLALAAEDDSQDGVIAGTPAYMAPEHRAGQPATVQSDLYSLGLVMYELFTGKRPREQWNEITAPSHLVRDLDPAVERVILRCLDPDPTQRPRSARDVLASLPGGDPLAAALAAGETPSPRIVAAAGTEGSLKPAVAIGLLAAIVALMATMFALMQRGRVQTITHLDKPPVVQLDHALAMLRELGIPGQKFTTYGLAKKQHYVAWAYVHDKANRRRRYERGLPVMSFWTREQPVPFALSRATGFKPELENPPQHVPGSSTIELDPRGRLVMLASVAAPSWSARPLDWRPLFAAAKLDPAAFTPAAPKAVPLSMADARAAWTGRHPEDGTPIRIEAAAWHGVPVLFRILAPWDEVDERSRMPFGGESFDLAMLALTVIITGVAVLFAQRNLRLRRGDLRGALRLGIAYFVLAMIGTLGFAEHRIEVLYELELFVNALAFSLFSAAVIVLLYIALEPFIRRRWPDRLISWTRLIEGRWRDPMVGRDILIGMIGGLLNSCLATASNSVPSGELAYLDRLGSFFELTFGAVQRGIISGLTVTFALVLFTVLLRRRTLAMAAVALLMFIAFLFASREPMMIAVFAAIAALIAITAGRFGLLAIIAFLTTFRAIFFNPTPDALAWYTARGLIAPLFILAIAAWAFRTSLGQRYLGTSASRRIPSAFIF